MSKRLTAEELKRFQESCHTVYGRSEKLDLVFAAAEEAERLRAALEAIVELEGTFSP